MADYEWPGDEAHRKQMRELDAKWAGIKELQDAGWELLNFRDPALMSCPECFSAVGLDFVRLHKAYHNIQNQQLSTAFEIAARSGGENGTNTSTE